jgi:hypothetical protein
MMTNTNRFDTTVELSNEAVIDSLIKFNTRDELAQIIRVLSKALSRQSGHTPNELHEEYVAENEGNDDWV